VQLIVRQVWASYKTLTVVTLTIDTSTNCENATRHSGNGNFGVRRQILYRLLLSGHLYDRVDGIGQVRGGIGPGSRLANEHLFKTTFVSDEIRFSAW